MFSVMCVSLSKGSYPMMHCDSRKEGGSLLPVGITPPTTHPPPAGIGKGPWLVCLGMLMEVYIVFITVFGVYLLIVAKNH